jgi:hypothetical protein
MDTAGRSLRSNFLSKLFSLTPSAETASISEAEDVEAPGRSSLASVTFSGCSVAMVLGFDLGNEWTRWRDDYNTALYMLCHVRASIFKSRFEFL